MARVVPAQVRHLVLDHEPPVPLGLRGIAEVKVNHGASVRWKRVDLREAADVPHQEAGIELFGTEVKSIRAGTMNLKDSYCTVQDGELFVHSMHISPYEHGNIFNKDPDRPKRLLMHKREIRKLHDLQKQDGYALIPLSLYFKDSRVKVELGLCKGKKTYDKRDAIAKRDAKREMERAVREKNR